MRTKRFRAAVVVDAGTLPQADAVVDASRKIISQPIRNVIDTGDDAADNSFPRGRH